MEAYVLDTPPGHRCRGLECPLARLSQLLRGDAARSHVTALTWQRLLDPAEPLFGLVADGDGALTGLRPLHPPPRDLVADHLLLPGGSLRGARGAWRRRGPGADCSRLWGGGCAGSGPGVLADPGDQCHRPPALYDRLAHRTGLFTTTADRHIAGCAGGRGCWSGAGRGAVQLAQTGATAYPVTGSALVPPRRLAVNPVRSGRKQR